VSLERGTQPLNRQMETYERQATLEWSL
jgi:hypothetical protein